MVRCYRRACWVYVEFWHVEEASLRTLHQSGRSRCGLVSPIPPMPIVMKNLRKLAKAGVTIAVGTDAGNIGTLHGPSSHYELDLMARAGMDNRSLLLAATRDAAKVFGDNPGLGTLEKRQAGGPVGAQR